MKRFRVWCALFLVAVLLGLAATWSAEAAEHDYRVTWTPGGDPTEEGVNRYTVDVTSATGNTYTEHSIGAPPVTEASLPIDEPSGTALAFTVKACRDTTEGDPTSEDICSSPTDPLTVIAPPGDPTTPVGLKVIRITIEVLP